MEAILLFSEHVLQLEGKWLYSQALLSSTNSKKGALTQGGKIKHPSLVFLTVTNLDFLPANNNYIVTYI